MERGNDCFQVKKNDVLMDKEKLMNLIFLRNRIQEFKNIVLIVENFKNHQIGLGKKLSYISDNYICRKKGF